jgi:hypothetical protein
VFISDAVNRTLWHHHNFHTNHARLVKLSQFYRGMPTIKSHQCIEQCSDCLITKMRKAARGSDPVFVATHLVQGLTLDIGFMFQKSKNAKRASILSGLNSCNAYYIVDAF